MSQLTPRQILDVVDKSLEEASRWPRLLKALGFDMEQSRPGPRLLNRALQDRGFEPAVDENDSLRKMLTNYPDAWWFAIAEEVTGRRDSSVQVVVDAISVSVPHSQTPIDSSAISSVRYDRQQKTLLVTFRGGGGTYLYENVSSDEYRNLMAADSRGAWFNKFLKDRHPFRRMDVSPSTTPHTNSH